jgi:hypothetical protein
MDVFLSNLFASGETNRAIAPLSERQPGFSTPANPRQPGVTTRCHTGPKLLPKPRGAGGKRRYTARWGGLAVRITAAFFKEK